MDLERRWIRVELDAIMLAEGRVAQHNSLSRQHPESRPPSMAERATADVVRGIKHDRSLTRQERLELAEEIVRLEKFGPPDRGEETNQQFAFRVVTQYPGVPTEEVARREAEDSRRIRAIRRAAGQDSKGRAA